MPHEISQVYGTTLKWTTGEATPRDNEFIKKRVVVKIIIIIGKLKRKVGARIEFLFLP